MSVINAKEFIDLPDIYKIQDGMGGVADIIHTLRDTSQDVMADWVWGPTNQETTHRTTVSTDLPDVAWGQLYKGTAASKGGFQQVEDTCGFIEGRVAIDTRMLRIYGENAAQYRRMQSRPFIEKMSQTLVNSMFYSNSATHPERPKGLGIRYSAIDGGLYGNQIVDAGGTGADLTSIWVVTWGGGDGVYAIHPKNVAGGITQEDKGEQRETDSAGNPYYVQEELITAHVGFTVGDPRHVVRIANIDVSDMLAGNVDLFGLLTDARYKMKNRRISKLADQMAPGRSVIYCNTDVLRTLDKLQTNSVGSDNYVRLRPTDLHGAEVLTYHGMPFRETDQLLTTETQIT